MIKRMMMIGLLFFSLCATQADARQPRAALIIGNSAYERKPLKNPVNDARDMAEALTGFGFDVTLLTDADRRSMIDAIQAFGESLSNGSAALVYFSGHGLQSQGNNYLIPLRADIEKEADIEFETVDANRILAHLQEANGKGVNILILDACRDNPFKSFMKSAKTGLAQMDAPTGSLIVYATAPNTIARDDPNGENSLFTRRLLDALRDAPTLNVLEMLIRVRKQVMKDTNGKQVPWESGSLTDLFYFAEAAPTPKQPTPTPQIVYVEVTPRPALTIRPAKTPKPTPTSTPLSVTTRKPIPSSCWDNETPGATCKEEKTGMEFVYVPGGCFMMGCGNMEKDCGDEKPRHKVCLQGLWIGKYEVTQAQWKDVMGNNPPTKFEGANHPAEPVSWNDAQVFLKNFQNLGNFGRLTPRLPSEAEWEYAARAGTQTVYSFGDDLARLGEYAWCDHDNNGTHPVGQKQQNAFGLYDMIGNVWERVADTWHDNYIGAPTDGKARKAIEELDGDWKVMRGGSWSEPLNHCRSASRVRALPDRDDSDRVGLRVVISRTQ